MGQEEALKILRENGGWMTASEIYRASDNSRSSNEEALRKLYRHGEVLKKQEKIDGRRINVWKTKE